MLQREQKKEYIRALLQSVTKYDRNLTKIWRKITGLLHFPS